MTRLSRRLAGALLGVLALLLAATGCGNDAGAAGGSATVNVFAAASLTAAFQDLAKSFEATHPGVHAKLNFGSSSSLAEQIRNGAPATVFASADEANMAKVTDELSGPPRDFARNAMTIITAPGNPKHIEGLADLARRGLVVSLCAPEVPAGRYARTMLDRAHVTVPQGSEELDVKQVVSRVALGEADAGIAYVTDARAAADSVASVAIPTAQNVIARYPAALVKGGGNLSAGRAFLDYLTSAQGRTTLQRYGFLAP